MMDKLLKSLEAERNKLWAEARQKVWRQERRSAVGLRSSTPKSVKENRSCAPSPIRIDREELNALRSQRLGGAPYDERQHFYECKACGQLGDVFHHDENEHAPIPLDG